MCRAGLALFFVLISASSYAQSLYVVGGIASESSRYRKIKAEEIEPAKGSGNAFSGIVRLGNALGERWGVEIELARGAVIHERGTASILDSVTATFNGNISSLSPIHLTSVEYETRARNETLSTTVWIRQSVGDHVAVAYLAGLGFSRTTLDNADLVFGYPLPASQIHVTSYAFGPVVGLETHVRLRGDYLKLIPSIRLHGLSDDEGHQLLLRASVGLGWFF